jgi:hypothetical protein
MAPEKLALRKRCIGSIGSGARRSQATKPAVSAAPAARAATTSTLPHPTSLPRTRPQTRPSAPPDTRATAGRSRRVGGPKLSRRRETASAAATIPMGTFTQKTQCQSRPWVTAPPTSGPMATAKPAIPPQMPTIAPRRSAGKAAVRMVRLSGMITAAPSPCTVRAAIRNSAEGATAQAADEAAKRARPAAKTRRRPSRSPRAAAVMMPPAKVRL